MKTTDAGSPLTTLTPNRLFAGLDLAVFEQQADGHWQSLGELPEWLELPSGPVDLAEHYPLLEAFLEKCEPEWPAEATAPRMESDVWTESDPRDPGGEFYLQAVACGDGGRRFLALRRLPQSLYTYQQLAHDFELEKNKVERMSQELELRRQQAERATEAKSYFLASMSHEIRTPLNAIIGMADVLADTPLNAEQKRSVEIFQRNGTALLNLINNILDLSKVEAGHMELESIEFDLRDVIAAAMETVEVLVKAKALTLECAFASGVPFYLRGDPTRLRQIVINLLGNSIKFTEKGGLKIRVEPDPDGVPCSAPGSGRLQFAITDTGIGIPDEKADKLFESFTQVDASTTRKYGGTGLGLSISKQLVELMGGRIWAESEPGVGSSFFFTAQFGVPADQTERRGAAVKKTPAANLEKQISGLKILLVDDSDDNRSLILYYLKNTNSQIDIAENGLIAIHSFAKKKYDLILMDIEMPVMDGYEATRRIREMEAQTGAAATSIFALTAHAFVEMQVRGYAAGFTSILTKPIRKAALLEAVAGVPPSRAKLTDAEFAEPESFSVLVEEGMEDVVPGYLQKRRADLAAYRSALAAGDFDFIRKLAHKMKGSGAGYGFPRFSELGGALEKAAVESDAGSVAFHLEQFALYAERIELKYSK